MRDAFRENAAAFFGNFLKLLSFFLAPIFAIGLFSAPIKFDAAFLQNFANLENVSAESFVVFDLKSGETLAERAPDRPHAVASLTKLMTTLLIFENHAPSEIVEISAPAIFQTPPVKMNLQFEEKITLQNLLRGLLISSANDAAVAVAIFDSKSVEHFVAKMNRRARQLNLQNTKFKNPHGLDAWGHFSTAREIAILASFLLQKKFEKWDDFFTQTIDAPHFTVFSQNGKIAHELKNTNLLLQNPRIFGIKTGTTVLAGQCLAILARDATREILIVVLGSQKRFDDAQILVRKFLQN